MIIVGIIKELIVEVKRWFADRDTNSKVYRKMVPLDERTGEVEDGEDPEYRFTDVTLANITVGDVLEIRDNEALPADCILLKGKDLNGQVYVETAALDGERNLKPLFAPKEINQQFSQIFGLTSGKPYEVNFQMIKPFKDLNTFDGKIKL